MLTQAVSLFGKSSDVSNTSNQESEDAKQGSGRDKLNNELMKLDVLASKYYSNGNYYDSLNYLRESYEIRKDTLGPEDEATIQNLSNLASALARVGNFDEAEAYFKRTLEVRLRLLGPNQPLTLESKNHLGVLFKQRHKLVDAYQMLSEAYEGFQEISGPLTRIQAEICYNYGIVLVLMGNRIQASKLFGQANKLLSDFLGPAHQHTLDALHWERRCIVAANVIRGDESTPYNSKAEWKDGTHCEICHSIFGYRQRQHHCRICSRAVCSACSPYRSIVYEFDKTSPSRICSICEQQGF